MTTTTEAMYDALISDLQESGYEITEDIAELAETAAQALALGLTAATDLNIQAIWEMIKEAAVKVDPATIEACQDALDNLEDKFFTDSEVIATITAAATTVQEHCGHLFHIDGNRGLAVIDGERVYTVDEAWALWRELALKEMAA